MKVGDLVRWKPVRSEDENNEVGVIIAFEINYDRFGDPIDRSVIINWSKNGLTEEIMYAEELEVINENR